MTGLTVLITHDVGYLIGGCWVTGWSFALLLCMASARRERAQRAAFQRHLRDQAGRR